MVIHFATEHGMQNTHEHDRKADLQPGGESAQAEPEIGTLVIAKAHPDLVLHNFIVRLGTVFFCHIKERTSDLPPRS